MTLRLLISLSLLLIAWQKAAAQLAPADDFFHSGARAYLTNNIPKAKEVVEMGLKMYPDDDKLKKLEALLNQQQQSQSSQSQQNQQQDKQGQQSSQQQKDSQSQKDVEAKKDAQKKSDQQKKDELEKQPPAQSKPDPSKDKPDEEKDGQASPTTAHAMTPKEAEQLLNAQKGNEQFLQMKPEGRPENQNRPFKDW